MRIDGQRYELATNHLESAPLRESFNRLAVKTFGLDFTPWHRAGAWGDGYRPYTLLYDGEAVSNVSVNILDFLLDGMPRRYIQLGTVMTDERFRGRGLCRALLERVLAEWVPAADAVYLFANGSVLDFYPKFGFVPRTETGFSCFFARGDRPPMRRLRPDSPADRRLLEEAVTRGCPFSVLSMASPLSLALFYWITALPDGFYYNDQWGAVVVASREGDTLTVWEVFGPPQTPPELLTAPAGEAGGTLVYGFTPRDTRGLTGAPIVEKDDTLFLLKGGEDIFTGGARRFPLLSHA